MKPRYSPLVESDCCGAPLHMKATDIHFYCGTCGKPCTPLTELEVAMKKLRGEWAKLRDALPPFPFGRVIFWGLFLNGLVLGLIIARHFRG